jgi:hypothetical protein
MTNVNEPKKLTEEDLKPADILLFSPCKDTESQLIAKITDSKVSHSAMIYEKTDELTEEAPPCASSSLLKDRLTDEYKGEVYYRTIHVMRLKDQWIKDKGITSMDPVLSRATTYMKDKVPYSNYNFYTLGAYMLLRKFIPEGHLTGLTRFLQIATLELIKALDKMAYGDVHPFICSQYVFNCYYTGDEKDFKYALQLKPSTINNSILDELMRLSEAGFKYAHNQETPEAMKKRLEHELKEALPGVSTYEGMMTFAHKFVDDLNAANDESALRLEMNNKEHEAFVNAAHDFFEMFVKLHNLKGGEKMKTPLEKVYAIQEYFVTPNDLLVNMDNLDYIGILDNERIK